MKCYTPAYQSQMLYPETVIVFSTFHIDQIRTPQHPPPPRLILQPHMYFMRGLFLAQGNWVCKNFFFLTFAYNIG